jgi:pyruvate,water dikinase
MSVIFLDCLHPDETRAGGKAQGLAKLLKCSYRVPHGFVLLAGGPPALSIEQKLLDAYDTLVNGESREVAVRSSGLQEDSAQQSWAGVNDTILKVAREQLVESIGKIQQSSERAKTYMKQQCDTEIAVVVQLMVHPEVSGVAFSLNPVTMVSS